jgi:hypothetical protein
MKPLVPRDRPATALAALRRLARPPVLRERCELCAAGLSAEHAHLVEVESRRLVCACAACAVLFDSRGAGKYRRVPRDVYYLADLRLTDVGWAALNLPIELAFFLHSTAAGGIVALYPSPAGATESPVAAETWQALADENRALSGLEPDVEALLVNRLHGARECYRVGVDRCYELVGLVRTHWRGLSGGTAVWEEIDRFFAGLRERSGATEGRRDA